MYCEDAPVASSASRRRELRARLLRHGWMEYLVVQQQGYPKPMATFRLVDPQAAARAGHYPMEHHFDLAPLAPLRGGLVELAEACIDRDVRAQELARPVGDLLARYLIERGHGHIISSVGIPLADGGPAAAAIYLDALADDAPEDLRVFPLEPLPVDRLVASSAKGLPPLLQAQLMLGAWVCGVPAMPAGLGSAEIPLLLPLSRLRAREARRFLARAA